MRRRISVSKAGVKVAQDQLEYKAMMEKQIITDEKEAQSLIDELGGKVLSSVPEAVEYLLQTIMSELTSQDGASDAAALVTKECLAMMAKVVLIPLVKSHDSWR